MTDTGEMAPVAPAKVDPVSDHRLSGASGNQSLCVTTISRSLEQVIQPKTSTFRSSGCTRSSKNRLNSSSSGRSEGAIPGHDSAVRGHVL